MKKTKLLLGVFLALGITFSACEKDQPINESKENVSNEIPVTHNENRTGDYTIGYYHNEILDEMIVTYRTITADNESTIYADIKTLSEDYTGGTAPSYDEFNEFRVAYIPNSELSMEDAEVTIEGTLISDMATALNEAGYITAVESDYYSTFNDAFYAAADFDAAEAVINSTIDDINSNPDLTEEERDRLSDSFDIAAYSFSYWRAEAEKGALSNWAIFASVGDERRGGRFIRALLKVGADICGGAVGAGIGFAIGGPVGGVGGGLAGGSAASVFMFN